MNFLGLTSKTALLFWYFCVITSSFAVANPLPIFALHSGRQIYTDPVVSRNGQWVGYGAWTFQHRNPHIQNIYWHQLPNNWPSFSMPTIYSHSLSSPDLNVNRLVLNSNGLNAWFFNSNSSNHFFSEWMLLGSPVRNFQSGSGTRVTASSLNDFGVFAGRLHTQGQSADRAVVFDTQGMSRILPFDASNVRGDTAANVINNQGVVGGSMVFPVNRRGILRAEPHAAVWVPTNPSLPKGEGWGRMPLDVHPTSSDHIIIGSSATHLSSSPDASHPERVWVGGNLWTEASASDPTVISFGFVRQGIGSGSQGLTILSGDGCRLIESIHSYLVGLPCVQSTLIGINLQMAVGYAYYRKSDQSLMLVPFYVPLIQLGSGIYDLNSRAELGRAALPSASPEIWDRLDFISGLSEQNTVVGMGRFRGDNGPALRGFVIRFESMHTVLPF